MANTAQIINIFEHERREFMSDKGGYVKTYRSIDKQAWSDDPVCMLVAQYLIRNAAFNHIAIEYRGINLELSPGQFVTTLDELAHKSSVYNIYDKILKSKNPKATSKSAVNSALKKLTEDGFLSYENTGPGKRAYTVITLPNYANFNSFSKTIAKTIDKTNLKTIKTQSQQGFHGDSKTIEKTIEKTKAQTLNTNDINNKDINTPLTPQGGAALFDVFWKSYPNKKSKPTGRKAFEKIAAKFKSKPDEFKTLVSKIISHVEKRKLDDPQWTKDSGQFIPMPATFLNQERWNDEYTTGASHESSQYNFKNNQQLRSNPNTRYSDAQAYLESRGLAGPRESASSPVDSAGPNVYGPVDAGTWESGE